MKYNFNLPDFPNSNFKIETSIWTGKSKLVMNNLQVEQSKEKGKPFLIPTDNGEFVKAFQKQSLPDFVPTLEINGIKNQIVEKLKWFQYAIGGIPILLLFVGGAIGGAIGALAVMTNFNIFRQDGTEISKYAKVLGVVVGSYILYFLFATIVMKIIN